MAVHLILQVYEVVRGGYLEREDWEWMGTKERHRSGMGEGIRGLTERVFPV